MTEFETVIDHPEEVMTLKVGGGRRCKLDPDLKAPPPPAFIKVLILLKRMQQCALSTLNPPPLVFCLTELAATIHLGGQPPGDRRVAHSRGEAVQVEQHIRLISPGLKAHLVVNQLNSTSLSKLWFQTSACTPYSAGRRRRRRRRWGLSWWGGGSSLTPA